MTATIEGAIVAHLQADAGVSAIVGTKIHPFAGAEDFPRPKLTYWRVDTQRQFSNQGPTMTPRARFQLDAWADNYLTARQLLDAVRQALDGYIGVMNGWTIQGIHALDERDQPATTVDPGKKAPINRSSLDVYVDYVEN